MDITNLKTPDLTNWHGYKNDLDVKYMHNLFYGKSWKEVVQYFDGARSIERADELLFCPRIIFQYYIQAYMTYLESDAANGMSDSASPFLRLLINRENKDPGSVKNIYCNLKPTIDYVSNNQEYFDADKNIYGDFKKLAEQIHSTCK